MQPRRRRPGARRIPGLAAAPVLLPVLLIAAWAFFPTLFTGHDPISGIPQDKFLPPTAEHWFGTDHLGRDVFSRVVHGTSQTFLTAGLAVLIGLVAGTLLGVLAATGGRAADALTMRLVDVLLAVPGFLIALIIVTASSPGPVSLGVGVGIAAVASFARVVRAEVLRVRNLAFVEAAFLSGGTYWTVLRRHLLPNAAGPVLSLVAVDLGAAVLVVSSLGFLGFGTPRRSPNGGC
ncbi:ABC transporter permease [Arthrobacter sp. ATA002]|uniref:ABC transporter permease n=1 Tax=Arthrobacter sp. ATA002 TaxID=2991715 RepID=UPI002E347708|nr:ABC transporter permease [Arthrobacter sp. ATA002]